MIPPGISLLFWGAVYEAYNAVKNPGRRWEVKCTVCDEWHRARSYNMALVKMDRHAFFSDDHPDDYEADPRARVVAGKRPEREPDSAVMVE
jgi:hypothetical protein